MDFTTTTELNLIKRGFETNSLSRLLLTQPVGRGRNNSIPKDITIVTIMLSLYFMNGHLSTGEYSESLEKLNITLNNPEKFSDSIHTYFIEKLQKQLNVPITGIIEPISKESLILAKNSIPILEFVGDYDCLGVLKMYADINPNKMEYEAITAAIVFLMLSNKAKGGSFVFKKIVKAKNSIQNLKKSNSMASTLIGGVENIISLKTAGIGTLSMIDQVESGINTLTNAPIIEGSSLMIRMLNKIFSLAKSQKMAVGTIVAASIGLYYEHNAYKQCTVELAKTIDKYQDEVNTISYQLEQKNEELQKQKQREQERDKKDQEFREEINKKVDQLMHKHASSFENSVQHLYMKYSDQFKLRT